MAKWQRTVWFKAGLLLFAGGCDPGVDGGDAAAWSDEEAQEASGTGLDVEMSASVEIESHDEYGVRGSLWTEDVALHFETHTVDIDGTAQVAARFVDPDGVPVAIAASGAPMAEAWTDAGVAIEPDEPDASRS
jgi:hypothetical protein